ncbi:MAG: trypsin-like peptidase domain-containing protein, partial [Clostridia bacterium]|nr:trypsin-like peptidase domain-containing protein [Clostridia bacterium]
MCVLFGVSLEEFSQLADGGSINISAPAAPVPTVAPTAPAAPAPTVAPSASTAPAAVVAGNGKNNLLITILIVVLCVAIVVSAIVGVAVTVVKPFLGGYAGDDTSGKNVYEKVNPSVFCITVKTENETLGGSGFFIDNNGTAVTNYHVIEGIKEAKVKLYNGEDYEVDKILGHDTVRDIAVIHVKAPKTLPVKLANSDRISTGDKVYAIGYPESFVLGTMDSTMTDGIISKTSYSVGGVRYIQSTVDITHGNSGGVLLNASGEVIGITTAGIGLGNVTYMNLSVPSNVINGVKRNLDMSVEDYASKYSKKITVTYMLDGMKFTVKTIYAAESVPSLTVDLTPLGEDYSDCEFLGWYADGKYAEPFDFNSDVAEKDITLYGKLRFKKTVVEYSVQGNEVGTVESETVQAGKSFTLLKNTYTKTGYNFLGWKIDGKSYAPGDVVTVDGTVRKLTVEADWTGIIYT